MMRTVSIVLIVAIALQTVGCSTWRPLAQANRVPKDDKLSSMRDQVLEKIEEGMAVRIRILEGTPAPIKGQVIECIVDEIGQESLTLIPITDHVRGTVKRAFELRFTDIVHIEYREFNRRLTTFTVGAITGATLGLALLVVWLAHAYSKPYKPY